MAYRPILLVEDNPDDEVLTLRALRKNNVLNPVTVARDGAEALEILLGDRRDSEMSPGLILLDLKLPKIDGLDVLRRLRADERTRLLPVVILTASRQEEDILAGYRDGANAYVRKPVSFAEFADVVGTIGVFWLLLSEPPPDLRLPPGALTRDGGSPLAGREGPHP